MKEALDVRLHPACEHLIWRLYDADVMPQPFPHVYLTRAFPEDYYGRILANLPSDEAYTDRTYENRAMVSVRDLNTPFWKELEAWMSSWDLINAVLETFEIHTRRLSMDVRLVRDHAGYEIKPHTDVRRKLVSLLFYLPTDSEAADAGTEVLIPNESGFTSDGSRRYEFDAFSSVLKAPFRPNTMFGFPRSDVSFHGVRATTLPVRNVLLLNLYVVK